MSKNPCGEIPIRQDITVLPADDPNGRMSGPYGDFQDRIQDRLGEGRVDLTNGRVRLGWVIHEEVGICYVNGQIIYPDHYQDFLDRIEDRLG